MSYRGDLDPRKPMPEWLARERCPKTTNRHTLRGIKYYRQMYQATPPWITDAQREQIARLYRECKRRRKRGENVVVDHIVPVNSPLVCGLMVPWNLQIIGAVPNSVKSNHWWPGHPNETLDMFPCEYVEPVQRRLSL